MNYLIIYSFLDLSWTTFICFPKKKKKSMKDTCEDIIALDA